MHPDEVQELLDCQMALVDAIAAGVSDEDRLSLDAELKTIRAALAALPPSLQPPSSDKGYPTRDASPLH